MAKTNIKFNNKNYSIENSLLADATAKLEAHLTAMSIKTAGLYRYGAFVASWDDLIANGDIVLTDGAIYCENDTLDGDLYISNEGVESIGDNAFNACGSLRLVVIPVGITSIGESAFCACTSMNTMTIGNDISIIGNTAFMNCHNLESVTIGDNVTSIGEGAFAGCETLRDITFKGTTEQWDSITKGNQWMMRVPATYVQCSDGQVAL